MTAPDFLPVLSAGAHSDPKQGACVMEYVSLLAGERWSDSPACTHPALAAVARRVNDRLPDGERQQLVPLIGRLFGTATNDKVVSVRLAVWSARRVLRLVRDQDRAVCEAAISAAERWCEGHVTEQECRYAYANADAYAAANADAYAYAAAYAANAAANAAAYAANAAANAATWAVNATDAATYAAAYAVADVQFLTALLDEYDRITGRTEVRELSSDDYATLVAATA